MSEGNGKVLRVSRFGRGSLWSAIDQSIRDAMPEYRSQPGMEAVWFGRRGPATGDERTIVTLWSSAEAEAASRTIPEMLQDIDVVAPSRVVLPVAFSRWRASAGPPGILRIYEGRTRRGQLARYAEVGQAATAREVDQADGPTAVTMTLAGVDRFLTVSTWLDWSSLEAYTAGHIERPLVSRDRSLIREGSPTHYELVY